MPSNPPDDGHLYGAAVEDEMLRAEDAYRELAKKMRRLTPRMPLPEPEFRTGDIP